MSLRVLLQNHGASGLAVYADVDTTEDSVNLTLDAEDQNEPSTWRILSVDEARALAAALNHYAREAQR